jgi:hypothetical protein
LVTIEWFLNGTRCKELVPLKKARHRKLELEAYGAIIYWSERS